MNSEKLYSILKSHIPLQALEYCFQLWSQNPFELKLSESRQTKIGDFTSRRSAARPRITLNNDLNPFLFLLTFIHEVAHLHVYLRFGNRVDPHGDEWKSKFQELMFPLLQESVFPSEILHELRRHLVNPKASSFADTNLTRVLRLYDVNSGSMATLSDIPEGSIFRLHNRFFKKGKLRRTRVLCREVKTKRHYLVPADSLVSDVQLSLL